MFDLIDCMTNRYLIGTYLIDNELAALASKAEKLNLIQDRLDRLQLLYCEVVYFGGTARGWMAAVQGYLLNLRDELDPEWNAGECAGCQWLTGETALPCAVNPLAHGQGCFDYE